MPKVQPHPADRLTAFAQSKLEELATKDRLRQWPGGAPTPTTFASETFKIDLSHNDYLGLSRDPRVLAAAEKALQTYGAGATGSRLISGNHPEISALETSLAAFKQTEAALVFSSGYAANLGTIPALMDRDSLIVVDERAHACLFGGAQLAKAEAVTFRHNDVDDLRAKIGTNAYRDQRVLILTDGVFSMDGDLAPLPELAQVARDCGAWLMVDDAHGLGVLAEGKGTAARFGMAAEDIPLQMGTLSKALGSQGGYVCASEPVIAFLANRARTFVYSTGLAPASAAAANAALSIIMNDRALTTRPLKLAQRFAESLGLNKPESPILPIIYGSETRALAAQKTLEKLGVRAVAIRPPTVPAGTSRLRLAFSASLSDHDVDQVVSILKTQSILP
ncbi:MAG: 8-amino-7-oxononanoate synthase [Pseudomonadota bacterium]